LIILAAVVDADEKAEAKKAVEKAKASDGKNLNAKKLNTATR